MHRAIWVAVTGAMLWLVLVFASCACAESRERVIHSFTGGMDGSAPIGNLLLDRAGNLYGEASSGGTGHSGVVFELTRDPSGQWAESVLYSFAGGSDGESPVGGVIFDQSGNLFGVTQNGGGDGCSRGCGTVFELMPGQNGHWTESVLYSFTGGSDGASPDAQLILDGAGNLYGTTQAGGDATCATGGCGTVFVLTPAQNGHWTQTVLHTFKGGSDGEFPFMASLVFDATGNLYSTTSSGGKFGLGTVFRLSPRKNGKWTETILRAFQGGSDGASPAAGLTLVGDILYGTTYGGGKQCIVGGCGTVYQMKADPKGKWTETVIHRFRGTDGIETLSTPILDPAGNLFGTTFEGGSGLCGVCGTAFELKPKAKGNWHESVLHDFGSRQGDAGTPEGGLIVNKAGKVFGTTALGGKEGLGAVFEIAP